MNHAQIHAAVDLADVLTRENRALRAMDLAAAASMLDDKMRALDAFAATQRESAAAAPGADPATARDVAARLRALGEENRVLLERGIAVQGRLLGMLATAARPAPLRYGARGAPTFEAKQGAVALSARA